MTERIIHNDDLIERLDELSGPRYPDDITGKQLMAKAATALRAFAEREKEMLEALKEAEFGLEAIVGFYARVTFTGSRVAADKQNPCISIAMKAQNVARAILSKHKEKSS